MHILTRAFFSVGILTATTPPITAQDITSDLIAHFPLNGTPNDMIGGLAPTVISGQPGFCADRLGNPNSAACFDGSSFWSYGDVLDVDTSDFVLSFWMRADSVPMEWEVSQGLFSSGTQPVCKGTTVFASPVHSGYTLQLTQPVNGEYELNWATGGQNDDVHIAANPITIGGWSHIAVMRCDTVLSTYVDGALAAASVTPPNRNLNTDIYFTIGALNRAPSGEPPSEWFIGALDEVRLYQGRCLSQEDLVELVNDGVGVELETSPPTALRVYPSPATDVIRIQASAPVTSLRVTDAMGRMMELPRVRFADGASGLKEFELPIAEWAAGAYFVRLRSEQGEAHGRFVKE